MQNQRGHSLIELILSMGLGLVAVLGMSRFVLQNEQLDKKNRDMNDLQHVRYSVLGGFDCIRTLGLDSRVAAPKCDTIPATLSLVHRNGKVLNPDGKIAGWDTVTSCDPSKKFLRVGLKRDGKDALTGEAWNTKPEAEDAFQGLIKFCKKEMATAEPASEDARDLQCFSVTRRQNAVTFSDPKYSSYAARFDGPVYGNASWGMQCLPPFARLSCAMANDTDSPFDLDVNYVPNGCVTDDEEWNDRADLEVLCCRKGQI